MCGEDVVVHSKQTLARSLGHTEALDSKNRVGLLGVQSRCKNYPQTQLDIFVSAKNGVRKGEGRGQKKGGGEIIITIIKDT